jgi:hypothetical protein
MINSIYSLRTEGHQYRITKFTDGEVEASYICTETECECPAGHRPSCRHRQMLPMMLANGILNTHWFYSYDTHQPVDFEGSPKSLLDALDASRQIEPAIEPPIAPPDPKHRIASWRRI